MSIRFDRGCPAEQYFFFIYGCCREMLLYTRERLRLWWSLTTADGVGTTGQSVRLFRHFRPWSAVATAGAFHAYSLEQRRALSAAAGWLECAHGTDKVPGEPELSRPMAGAAPTPSIGMCALHVCRCVP